MRGRGCCRVASGGSIALAYTQRRPPPIVIPSHCHPILSSSHPVVIPASSYCRHSGHQHSCHHRLCRRRLCYHPCCRCPCCRRSCCRRLCHHRLCRRRSCCCCCCVILPLLSLFVAVVSASLSISPLPSCEQSLAAVETGAGVVLLCCMFCATPRHFQSKDVAKQLVS